jgi:hypothetical protein
MTYLAPIEIHANFTFNRLAVPAELCETVCAAELISALRRWSLHSNYVHALSPVFLLSCATVCAV